MSMPDQSSAASEHSIIQQVAAPLATLPDAELQRLPAVDFPVVLRGYDRLAVDAYVKKTAQLVSDLQATRSPEGAVRRALERVGEQISGILQRAHDTAEQITAQSRREAEDRLERARQEASELTSGARVRVKDLDADADRIWAERQRIVDDARDLARQLLELSESAAERFPPAEEPEPAPALPAAGAGEDDDADDQVGALDPGGAEPGEPAGSDRDWLDESEDTMILPSRPPQRRPEPPESVQRRPEPPAQGRSGPEPAQGWPGPESARRRPGSSASEPSPPQARPAEGSEAARQRPRRQPSDGPDAGR